MKNITKSLYLMALCTGGIIAPTISYAEVTCTGTSCAFANLADEEDRNPFVCDIVGEKKPTEITFKNHNVLITGFDKTGTLKLSGKQVDQLSQYYFDAKKDKSFIGSVSATVVGGEITCKSGTGGRSAKWPGPYGK